MGNQNLESERKQTPIMNKAYLILTFSLMILGISALPSGVAPAEAIKESERQNPEPPMPPAVAIKAETDEKLPEEDEDLDLTDEMDREDDDDENDEEPPMDEVNEDEEEEDEEPVEKYEKEANVQMEEVAKPPADVRD